MRGSGNVVTETREVSGFDEVALGGIGTAIVTQGEAESLTIEAEDTILPHITTTVRDGRLTIGFEKDRSPAPRPTAPIRFRIGVRDLRAVRLSGAGKVEVGPLRADRLEVAVTGAGGIALERLAAEALTVGISGAGQVRVAGEAATQELTITGAGEYRAGELATREARVTVSGAGSARVRVSDALDVRITGAGSVEYAGSPRVSRQLTGIGRVRRVASAI